MLHIKKIHIKNFRPYYGEQTFDFGDKKGISLILGENGIGKTSFIKAMKYVLFGTFDNKEDFPEKEEINKYAWSNKDYNMYINLEFNYCEDYYSLKRGKRPKANVIGEPQTSFQFEEDVTMFKNGIPLDYIETNNLLNQIIPTDLSEYVLFEGETIKKYEALLDNTSSANMRVRDSIRKILGINAIENSKDDVEKVKNDLSKERDNIIKKNTANEKIKKEIDFIQEKITNLEEQKKKFEHILTITEKEKNEIINKLEKYDQVKQLIADSEKITNQISNTKEKIKNEQEKLKKILKDYKSLARDVIQFKINEINTPSLLELKKNHESNLEKEAEIEKLQKQQKSPTCSLCGTTITRDQEKHINNKINELRKKIIYISSKEATILKESNNKLRGLTFLLQTIDNTCDIEDIKIIENEINLLKFDLKDLEQKLNAKKEQINATGGEEQLLLLISKLQSCDEDIAEASKALEQTNSDLEKEEKELQKKLKSISGNVDLTKIDKKLKKLEKIFEIFNTAITKYADKMRMRVESDATHFFKKVSREPDYDRLSIDNSYGLTLIDKHGDIVPNPSDGYKTLIAISLIYGLHKNSTLSGSIILDAPFSMILGENKENLLPVIYELSPQVILLAVFERGYIDELKTAAGKNLINEFVIWQDKTVDKHIYRTEIEVK